MAYTQADLDRLDAAIAKGVLTVTMNGKTVTYRSTRDLLDARSHVQTELDRSKQGGNYTTTTYGAFSRD